MVLSEEQVTRQETGRRPVDEGGEGYNWRCVCVCVSVCGVSECV